MQLPVLPGDEYNYLFSHLLEDQDANRAKAPRASKLQTLLL